MKTHDSISSDVRLKAVLAAGLILFAVVARLIPHPANFAPIAAIALFGGAILPRNWALSLPVIAMIASDLLIGLHPLVMFTWGSFAIVALGSNTWLKNIKAVTVGTASLAASVFFFLVSNFGVWLEGRMYSYTLEGLLACYYNALPFFRGTLLGDLVYSAVIFGAYAFAYRVVFQKKGDLSLHSPSDAQLAS